MIGGGTIIVTCSGLGAVRRRHVSQPSRQYCTPSSTLPTPSHLAMSSVNGLLGFIIVSLLKAHCHRHFA
jgi:hypothetical protein